MDAFIANYIAIPTVNYTCSSFVHKIILMIFFLNQPSACWTVFRLVTYFFVESDFRLIFGKIVGGHIDNNLKTSPTMSQIIAKKIHPSVMRIYGDLTILGRYKQVLCDNI